MRQWTFLLVPLLAMGSLLGQPLQGRGAGFGYAAFGGSPEGHPPDPFWIFGAGAEFVGSNGLGLRLDGGALTDVSLEADLFLLAFGLMIEFEPERQTAPFLSGGYTLFIPDETGHGFHFGGGVRHWFREGFGIRFEVRDDVQAERRDHFISGRVSFLFR